MQVTTIIIARSHLLSLFIFLVFTEIKPLTFIVGEKDIYILSRIVNSIMSLEIEETCRTTHCTHRCHERKSLAAIINCTCSTGLNSKICLLCQYFFSWPFRIIVFIVLFADFQKICLTRRAGVFTPQSFDIDSADITSPRASGKNTVNLF